jgi:hypothetical protein
MAMGSSARISNHPVIEPRTGRFYKWTSTVNHIKCSKMKMLAFSQNVGNETHETLILWFYLCDFYLSSSPLASVENISWKPNTSHLNFVSRLSTGDMTRSLIKTDHLISQCAHFLKANSRVWISACLLEFNSFKYDRMRFISSKPTFDNWRWSWITWKLSIFFLIKFNKVWVWWSCNAK